MNKLSRLITAVVLGMILFVVVLYWPAQVRADTITVCASGCNYERIQDAVDAAVDHDLILVSAGTYTENVVISKTLIIQGTSMMDTVVDAHDAGRGFTILAGSQVTLTDMLVTHGRAPLDGKNAAHGGGIWNAGELALIRVRIEDNVAIGGDASPPDVDASPAYGGGLYNACAAGMCARTTMLHSQVRNNRATGGDAPLGYGGDAAGGGVYNACGGLVCAGLALTETIMANNSALGGAGLPDYDFNYDGEGEGGGILNAGRLDMADTTITLNRARRGGGIHNICTDASCGRIMGYRLKINDNQATTDSVWGAFSGGLSNQGVVHLVESEINHNLASGGYCFIFYSDAGHYAGVFNSGVMTLTRTLIAGNQGYDGCPGHPYGVIESKGGGVTNAQGQLALHDVVVTENRAAVGAGIYQREGGDTWLENSKVMSNTGHFCVGICNQSGRMTIAKVTVSHNFAIGRDSGRGRYNADGAGVWNGDQMEVIQANILANIGIVNGGLDPSAFGGGIHNRGHFTMSGSAVYNNVITTTGSEYSYGMGTKGGGIYNRGFLAAINSTISGNVAGTSYTDNQDLAEGGGLYIDQGATTELTNVTISKNIARAGVPGNVVPIPGGGIYLAGDLAMLNTIVAGNAGTDCVGVAASLGHNLAGDDSCALSGVNDLNNIDPMLGPLGNYGGLTLLHPLSMLSPAVDSGDDILCPATDQRGVSRPRDGNNDGTAGCDRGAFERSPFIPSSWLYLPAVFDS